ncbi:MAG: CopD family protein [Thermoleophilia bacterium]
MRRTLSALVAVLALLVFPTSVLGHAVVINSSPELDQAISNAPDEVVIQFSEPVKILNATTDFTVVDETGEPVVSASGAVSPDDATVIRIPLRRGLPDGNYTVRYKIVSADSHIIGSARAFAIGPGPVGPPFLGQGVDEGPSETSPWSVAARFFELVGLGGLFGLLGFRWLAWRTAWRSPRLAGLPNAEREAALEWGRDTFWVAFGALAVGSMLAEAYLLVTYSASALGTRVLDTLGNTTGISDVLATTRFGSLLQLRGGLLFALFAVGAWQFIAEFGSNNQPRPATVAGAKWPALAMAALLATVLYGVSSQGHASQAPIPRLQVFADLLHVGAAAVWIAGLAVLAVVLVALPRVAERSGPDIATAVLVAFSRVALVSVGVILATGTIRTVGQVSDPSQLWSMAYGVTLLIKLGLLATIMLIAMYNRRVTNALVLRPAPPRATLTRLRRTATAELGLAMAAVLVASVLVAQVPGRV